MGKKVARARGRQPADQRYRNGPICSAPSVRLRGKGAGCSCCLGADARSHGRCNLDRDQCRHVDPESAHAVVLIVDRAGWHLTTGKLAKSPKNLTIMALLPSRAPELNPVENIWQYLRANWLSNRDVRRSYECHRRCCDAEAWNKLVDQPWKIMSLGMRKWAHGFTSMTVGMMRRL